MRGLQFQTFDKLCKIYSSVWTKGQLSGHLLAGKYCTTADRRTKPLPTLYLFTKEECSLCDIAKEALAPYMHRFVLTEVDITLPENKTWHRQYRYDIPVFHLNEEFVMKHKVDFKALEAALKKYEGT